MARTPESEVSEGGMRWGEGMGRSVDKILLLLPSLFLFSHPRLENLFTGYPAGCRYIFIALANFQQVTLDQFCKTIFKTNKLSARGDYMLTNDNYVRIFEGTSR